MIDLKQIMTGNILEISYTLYADYVLGKMCFSNVEFISHEKL